MNNSTTVFALGSTAAVVVAVTMFSNDLIPWHPWSKGVVLEAGPTAEIDESLAEHELLARAYVAKLANPDYQTFKSAPGAPTQFQSFAEEAEIKSLRAAVARALVAPVGVRLAVIPKHEGAAPAIDGRFGEREWDDALVVAMGTQGFATTLYLMADEGHLYLACDAQDETTDGGYDQFRFYWHLDTTESIVNERIHVGRHSRPLGGIRQTRVRWQGVLPTDGNERWKTYDISDWQIFEHARGASLIDGHRRYEVSLELAEIGLHRGVPFPAWAQVETDPAQSTSGKTGGRRYLGQVGAPTAPGWFVIE